MESNGGVQESELFLQWGNRKRSRFPRTTTTRDDKKMVNNPTTLRSNANNKKSSSSSPENNHHYTKRRGGLGLSSNNNNNHHHHYQVGVGIGVESNNNSNIGKGHGNHAWPKLYLALSDKEKEEDFMAMKGCKLPQRPKKRPKAVQKTLLLVCPGGWLADMYHDRYEIREKKSSKKRPRGLKAMGSVESDSE